MGIYPNLNYVIYNKFYRVIFILETGLFEAVVLYEPNIFNKRSNPFADSLTLVTYKLFQKYPH